MTQGHLSDSYDFAIIGSGFGHEYFEMVEANRVDQYFAQYKYIAHNSVLWLLSLSGFLGFAAVWLVFPVAVLIALVAHGPVTALIMLAIVSGYIMLGMRRYARIQKICFYGGMLGLILVLVLLFHDFVQPVTILAALVLSVPGAFLALFVLGFPVVLAIGVPCIVYMVNVETQYWGGQPVNDPACS